MTDLSTFSIPWLPTEATVGAAWKWLWGHIMPRPLFLGIERTTWLSDPHCSQWKVRIGFKEGHLWWKYDAIANCRLFYIRKDYGPPGEPEGIWLKWSDESGVLESLEATLIAGKVYESTLIVRDEREGTAYVANEEFVSTNGTVKKWPLPAERGDPLISERAGRYTFWLEVRDRKRRWRSENYYVVSIPAAGQSNSLFTLEALAPPPKLT